MSPEMDRSNFLSPDAVTHQIPDHQIFEKFGTLGVSRSRAFLSVRGSR
jgi:hypothetical protein